MHRLEYADLVIVGGGPAGMSAAIEARAAGVRSVVLLDEGPSLGGQIFRRYGEGFRVTDARAAGHEYSDGEALIEKALASGADIRSSTIVWGIWNKQIAYVSGGTEAGTLVARTILLATGARDRAVAFPGWTLPGVMTAGAAKIMVAIQRVLPGKRILMAGSGPLALAFSAQLRNYGANVVEVTEAAPGPGPAALLRLATTGEPATLMDAARYRTRLMRDGVPFSYSTIILRAEGDGKVERAVVAKVDRDWRVVPGSERTIEVDSVLSGYGLESSTELSRLIGCRHSFDRDRGGWLPDKDEMMRTTLPGVYAAGDGSGVGGAPHAMAEGRIAGIMLARELGTISDAEAAAAAAPSRARLARLKRFVRTLNAAYRIGPGLFELATPETLVCRCEERTAGDLDNVLADGVADPNIVRALSRIGMGRCQGRNCASHVTATIARRSNIPADRIPWLSSRPPVRPVSVAALAEERVQHESAVEIR